ncbi:hypothetical protein CEUSTIGMA_g13373.t1 [Chlamydomonas eustigma]|uniref:SGNH hydrolase-type esterase domain-containing protein n=1 Tax=Chlamydomonas eustigma TaxID=1157962 RepID=A0A250XSA1_9CHLO|nr:hypothetical protein CEUSTIGMA_g13373.t1 [Chlamydomonas eustigma]|eukprot:GAX85957.1 hypothetical protein CEUSTIGMA_g13373.t1 [Chlamydomonas eustigma]
MSVCIVYAILLVMNIATEVVLSVMPLEKLNYSVLANRELPPMQRIWTDTDLSHAWAVLNYDQMRPFITKLENGEPIAISALGDSILKDYGGCYHTSLSGIQQVVEQLGPAYMNPRCSESSYPSDGWLSRFMYMINHTWPHGDHLLINHGISAMSFHAFAHGSCLERYIPPKTDLLILEHLPYLDDESDASGQSLALLLNRLRFVFHDQILPPVIVLNMHRLTSSKPTTWILNCLRNISSCGGSCSKQFLSLPHTSCNRSDAEIGANKISEQYGLASFSFNSLLIHLASQNRSRCELFSTLFMDALHPSSSGSMLFADVLVQYLNLSLQHNYHQQNHTLSSSSTGSGAEAMKHIVTLRVPYMKCYGYSTGYTSNASHSNMRVRRMEGWVFSESDMSAQNIKPGWLAKQPGAVIEIEIDLNISSQVVNDTLLAGITYLASYQHMGKFSVVCLSGCQCNVSVIDGHIIQKHSVPLFHEFIITRTPHNTAVCVVQALVLNSTRSGEHKAKITQVFFKTWIETEYAHFN